MNILNRVQPDDSTEVKEVTENFFLVEIYMFFCVKKSKFDKK